jgi:predicted DNA-binding ArsR family transcriptional regulator
MNKTQIDDWRVNMQSRLEELTVLNAKQSSDISHVKESLDEVKTLIKEQNGRVRELEGGMSGIKAIGGMLSAVFSGLFGYLFTKG